MTAKMNTYPTKAGWYCIGWNRLDTDDQANFGPDYQEIIYFDGKIWNDEEGREVEYLIDPVLSLRVAMDSADYYALQS